MSRKKNNSKVKKEVEVRIDKRKVWKKKFTVFV